MNKECIILAGGRGTRLQSVVNDVPKCMAEVTNVPFLQHLFDYLEKERFEHLILALGYKSDIIIDWLDKQHYNFRTSYVVENEALGTGGAIQFAFSKVISDRALVLNGDTFFNIDTDSLYQSHEKNGADISIALKPMINFDRYGTVNCDREGRIIKFNEKKQTDKGLINGGVYLVNKYIFSKLNLPEKFSFEKYVLETQLDRLTINGEVFEKYFVDIGIPSDFEKANVDFRNNKHLEE